VRRISSFALSNTVIALIYSCACSCFILACLSDENRQVRRASISGRTAEVVHEFAGRLGITPTRPVACVAHDMMEHEDYNVSCIVESADAVYAIDCISFYHSCRIAAIALK